MKEAVDVRLAHAGDLSEILRMRNALLTEENDMNAVVGGDMDAEDAMRYNVDAAKDLLDGGGVILVADSGDGLVGFLSFLPGKYMGLGGRAAKSTGFWVDPERRGSPIAYRLWKRALEAFHDADALQITTVAGNNEMERLAKKCGFIPVGTIWERR
jgi:RimJ/RimL family protein N-acetyltransferase